MIKPHPQRLALSAPPGTLQKRLIGLNVRAKLKDITDSDPVYLAQIRQLPCLKCGMEPPPNVEAAHIRRQSAAHGKRGGMGKKPPDRFTLPLCHSCHRTDRDALHNIGEDLFFHILGIDPLRLCEQLYAKRGDLLVMRSIVILAIAER